MLPFTEVTHVLVISLLPSMFIPVPAVNVSCLALKALSKAVLSSGLPAISEKLTDLP